MHSLDILTLHWVLASCAVLLAAFIRGVSGFGLSIVLAPILLLILSPKSVVVINLLLALVSNILVLRQGFRHVSWKRVIPMSATSLLGIPIGVWIITVISPSALKILIAGITILFAIPLALGFSRTFAKEGLACGVSGFLSGILSTSTSMGGPPVVMLMHNQNWDKQTIYSSLAIFFLFSNICSLVALAASHLIDTPIIMSAVFLTPALIAGIVLGMEVFPRIKSQIFRYISLAIIIGSGILGIISATGLLS